MTVANKKVTLKLSDLQKPISNLQLVSYIYYPVQFKEESVKGLIYLASEVNIMTLMFAKKLSFRV